jgi:hypothetical protein
MNDEIYFLSPYQSIHFPTKEGSFLRQEKFFKIHKIEFKRKFFLKIGKESFCKTKKFFY